MPPPVLLIHGCLDSWQAWQDAGWMNDAVEVTSGETSVENWQWQLRRAQGASIHPPGAPKVFVLNYETLAIASAGQAVAELAEVVADAIAAVRTQTGATKVALVTHSLGGIIARAHIQGLGTKTYQKDVIGLYTIACPHRGISQAFIAYLPLAAFGLCPAVLDLGPSTPTMTFLNTHALPTGMHMRNFSGLGCSYSCLFGNNDGGLFERHSYVLKAVGQNTIPAETSFGHVPWVKDDFSRHTWFKPPVICPGTESAVVRARPEVDAWYLTLP